MGEAKEFCVCSELPDGTFTHYGELHSTQAAAERAMLAMRQELKLTIPLYVVELQDEEPPETADLN